MINPRGKYSDHSSLYERDVGPDLYWVVYDEELHDRGFTRNNTEAEKFEVNIEKKICGARI